MGRKEALVIVTSPHFKCFLGDTLGSEWVTVWRFNPKSNFAIRKYNETKVSEKEERSAVEKIIEEIIKGSGIDKLIIWVNGQLQSLEEEVKGLLKCLKEKSFEVLESWHGKGYSIGMKKEALEQLELLKQDSGKRSYVDKFAPFEKIKQFFFLSSEIEIDKAYITHKLLSPFLAIHIDLQKLKDRDFSYEFWNELKEAYQGKLGGLCKYVKSMKEHLKTKMKDYNWKPIDDLFSDDDDRLGPVTTVVGALNEGDMEQLGNNFKDIGELIKKFCDWITDLQKAIDSLNDTKKETGS